jgi:signal peptidase
MMNTNMKISENMARVLAFCLLLGVGWLLLAPVQLGGRYIYTIITGNSMEPNLHNGELAMMQPAEDYQIGEVVVYEHPSLGHVIHRIIAKKGDRYTLQGDNNAWVDGYQPTKAEIYGSLRLHIPYAGKVVKGFRTPLGAAALAGVVGFFLFWPENQAAEDAEALPPAIPDELPEAVVETVPETTPEGDGEQG